MLTDTSAKSVGAARVAAPIGIPVCVQCQTTFADETLSVHYFSSKLHPKCKPCNLGFPDSVAHHAVSDRFDPDRCSRSGPPLVQQHMIYGHGAVQCGKCPSVFGTVSRLQRHYEIFPSHGPGADVG